MEPNFWQNKWQSNKVGFNQSKPNTLLMKHFSALQLPPNSCVFVPLCGKSIDMVWLADQGCDVVGVELVELAVEQFFEEHQIQPTIVEHPTTPNLKYYQGHLDSQTITLWVGDIFELTAQDLGSVDAIYDRAALVALPDDGTEDSLRVRYSQQLIKLAPKAQQLLLSFGLSGVDEAEYAKYSGPPFIIPSQQIYGYYQQAYDLTLVEAYETQQVNSEGNPFLNLAWQLVPH